MMRLLAQRIAANFRGEGAARQLARGTVVSFLIQATGVGLILLAEILLARVLGTSGYGLYATVMAWVNVLAMIALLGSNHLLLRFVPTYVATMEWSRLNGLLRHCIRTSLTSGVGIYIAALLTLALLREDVTTETFWAFVIGIAAVPVAALSQQRQAILRGLHRVIEALSPELIVRPLLLMLLVVGLAWVVKAPVSAPIALSMNGLALIAAFLLGRHWQRNLMPIEARTASPIIQSSGWQHIAVPLFLIAAMQLLIVRLDIILLGALEGHEQAGRYAAASRVADLVVFALASANVIVAPLIAGLHARNDIAGMQHMLALLAKGITLLTLPVVVIIGFFGQSILGLFGHDYEVAYLPLLILVCGQVVNALSGPVDFIMAMTGQQMKMLQILALATGLNLVLNLLLIPPLGLLGAAIATASTTIFWNLFMRRVVRQRLGVDASVLILFRRRLRG